MKRLGHYIGLVPDAADKGKLWGKGLMFIFGITVMCAFISIWVLGIKGLGAIDSLIGDDRKAEATRGYVTDSQLVGLYCHYGATSPAQHEGCIANADPDDVWSRDSPAAQYARGERATCGLDAGPYCSDHPYD